MIEDFLNTKLTFEERTDLLVKKLTLEEKVSQMLYVAPAIDRLNIPAYTWWNESLHGVARAGTATVFPQSIALAASFNDELMYEVASAISDEARAKHHEFLRHNDTSIYKGLTMWSPNINIFRDPRWGRGHETYGEDTYLTSTLGQEYIKGLQGDDPKYLKVVATPKHYAVHSGPEDIRHSFDAVVSEKDLRETYLPAFRDCIVDAKAYSIMGAYNRTNGEACCGSYTLLEKILREEWKFEGFVVSDCWAICDFHKYHGLTNTAQESAALAVINGCDLNCGPTYTSLLSAISLGIIKEETIDISVKRLFLARFKLGMFDSPEDVPYASIPIEVNDSKEHRDLSIKASKHSLVLLKNDGILPISKDIKKIAVVGPNSNDREVLLGNYEGIPSRYKTVLEGIMDEFSESEILYSKGCHISQYEYDHNLTPLISEAVSCANRSDLTIIVTGLNARIEGEQPDEGNAQMGGDKIDLKLPGRQNDLIKAISKTNKPFIVINLSGSSIDLGFSKENANAILQSWYPGSLGGIAIAETLSGKYSPSGKLPITFYKSCDQLPAFDDYSMLNRTYKYFTGTPLYPFGYGLSYSKFNMSNISISENKEVTVDVKNNGPYDANQVIQLYIKTPDTNEQSPKYQLKGFKNIFFKNNENKTISFSLDKRKMSFINSLGKRVLLDGEYTIYVGFNQADEQSELLTNTKALKINFTINDYEELIY